MSDSDSDIFEVIGSSELKQKHKSLKQFRKPAFVNMNNGQSTSSSFPTMTEPTLEYAGLPSAPAHINITQTASAHPAQVNIPILTKDEFQLFCNLMPEFNPDSQHENDLSRFIRKTDKYYKQMVGKLTAI